MNNPQTPVSRFRHSRHAVAMAFAMLGIRRKSDVKSTTRGALGHQMLTMRRSSAASENASARQTISSDARLRQRETNRVFASWARSSLTMNKAGRI